jgi:leucine-zipper of insertion element IS481
MIASLPTGTSSVAQFCREQQISRQTFYKWRARYEAEGLDGFQDRSRRPSRVANQTSGDVEDLVVRMRKQLADAGEFNGPDSIHDRLIMDGLPAGLAWGAAVPSRATIARILTRRGLVKPQPRKRPRRPHGVPRSADRTQPGLADRLQRVRDSQRWDLAHLRGDRLRHQILPRRQHHPHRTRNRDIGSTSPTRRTSTDASGTRAVSRLRPGSTCSDSPGSTPEAPHSSAGSARTRPSSAHRSPAYTNKTNLRGPQLPRATTPSRLISRPRRAVVCLATHSRSNASSRLTLCTAVLMATTPWNPYPDRRQGAAAPTLSPWTKADIQIHLAAAASVWPVRGVSTARNGLRLH